MDYIDRSVVVKKVMETKWESGSDGAGAMEIVAATPAADVAPVVRAEWVNPHWRNNDYCYDCSNCGGEAMHRVYRWRDEKIYPICPNCGARMYGGADNETD